MSYEGPHPLPVSSGGTGKASLTTYQPITGGTTSTAALQQVVSAAAGQVLQSGGSAALPVYVAPSAVGTLILLSSQSSTSGSTVSFTSVMNATYSTYCLVFSNVVKSASSSLGFTVSTNNGSSYLITGYTSGIIAYQYNNITPLNGNSTTNVLLSQAAMAVAIVANGTIYLRNCGNGGQFTCDGSTVYGGTAPLMGNICALNTATTVNAFQVSITSGAFTSGSWSLYGVIS